MKLIFIFSILSTFLIAKEDMLENWTRLIKINKTINENDKSNYFIDGKNAEVEFQDSIKKLKKNPTKFYCEFPSRYLFLEKHNYIERENKTCADHDHYNFILKKKNISLVLSSEMVTSPASLFGHIMLVFHDEYYPELDSIAVHFAADTGKRDSISSYIYKGLSGGYWGKYYYTPFFEKVSEYTQAEQRTMHIYNLKLNDFEKKYLMFQLYEMYSIRFAYYFFSENCASHIYELLSNVFEMSYNKRLYTYPTDIIKNFQHKMTYLGKIDPYLQRSIRFIKKPEAEINKIHEILNGKKVLSIEETDETKNAIYYLYSSMFKSNKEAFANYRTNIDASRVSDPLYSTEKGHDILLDEDPLLMQLGFFQRSNESFFMGRIRPTYRDQDAFAFGTSFNSSLSLLDTSFLIHDNNLKLISMDVFKLQYYFPFDEVTKKKSWQTQAAISRFNPSKKLVFGYSFGLGYTYNYKNFLATFLLDSTLNVDSNFGGLGPQIYIKMYINENLYFSQKATYKAFIEDGEYSSIESSINARINRNMHLSFGYLNDDFFKESIYLKSTAFF